MSVIDCVPLLGASLFASIAEIVNVYVFLGVLMVLVLVLVLVPQPTVTMKPEMIIPSSTQAKNLFRCLLFPDNPTPISASAGSGSHNA